MVYNDWFRNSVKPTFNHYAFQSKNDAQPGVYCIGYTIAK